MCLNYITIISDFYTQRNFFQEQEIIEVNFLKESQDNLSLALGPPATDLFS